MFAAYWLDNDGIVDAISSCYDKTGYTIDPHGAIAWKAWYDIKTSAMESLVAGQKNDIEKPGLVSNIPEWADSIVNKKAVGIILETAHPAKFGSTVQKATGNAPLIPDRLEKVMNLPDKAVPMENDYNKFKEWLLANLA
jgi:threonine synthase